MVSVVQRLSNALGFSSVVGYRGAVTVLRSHLGSRWTWVLLVLASVASACGADGRRDAQPAPGVSVFRDGRFDEIPRYPRTDPLGGAVEKGDVVSQSFVARNATPHQVLEYYERSLAGWSVVEPVRAVGEGAVRGAWAKDGRHLVVSAGLAPTVEADDPERPMAQYNLQLGPPGAVP